MAVQGITTLSFPKALVNAYLVEADELTLIDTGTPGGAGKVLKALNGRRLSRILLTHRHADHAGNAAKLAQETGATVYASRADAAYITDAREQPKPKTATFLGRLLVPYVRVALPWTLDPAPVEATLTEGTTIGPFRVVETPGHTEGHVSFLWEERGVLFTGDAAANITGVGPHPAADDPQQAGRSYEKFGDLEFDTAVFGHGRPVKRDARAAFGHRQSV